MTEAMNRATRRWAGLGVALLCALASWWAWPAAAPAAGTGNPVISSPVAPRQCTISCATVPSPFTGPVTVDFSNAPTGSYSADLTCPDTGDEFGHSFTYTGAGDDVQSWTLPSPLWGPSENCTLSVQQDTAGTAASDHLVFSVAPSRPPVITAPRTGAKEPSGFTGPVSFNFADRSPGEYLASVSCTRTSRSTFVFDDYTAGQPRIEHWTISPPIVGPQSCTLAVRQDATGSVAAKVAFTVAPRPLTLTNPAVTPAIFYPLVRDRYRDTAAISYRLNRAARITAVVRTSTGHLVRRVTLGTLPGGGHRWVWNGRKNDGTKVRPGSYRMQITAGVDGLTRSVTGTVRVATGWRVRKVATYRTGYDTSNASRTQSCHVNYFYDDGTVELDCWGGSYAQASYRFALPAHAYAVSWHVNGHQSCCDNGTITKQGARSNPTHYVVTVKVTDWRAYTIDDVELTYKYKARI